MAIETMTVRVRDRAAEAPWGSGPTSPVIRSVTIPAVCPRCNAHRGQPRTMNQHDDGVDYSVDVWDNPDLSRREAHRPALNAAGLDYDAGGSVVVLSAPPDTP